MLDLNLTPLQRMAEVQKRTYQALKDIALELPQGKQGHPVDCTMLAISLGDDLLPSAPEVLDAVHFLAETGKVIITKETDELWVRVPLTSADRQRRRRAKLAKSGMIEKTVTIPASLEAELDAWIRGKLSKV